VTESEGLACRWIRRQKTREGWRFVSLGPKPSQPKQEAPAQPSVVPSFNRRLVALQKRIIKAAGLYMMGYRDRRLGEAMGVTPQAVKYYQRAHRELWERACIEATGKLEATMNEIIASVRQQVNTDRILGDPEKYLALAATADRWSNLRGEQLFPVEPPTLCTFYENYYLPTCLGDASRNTLAWYRIILKRWRLITGDPPLTKITPVELARFRDALSRCRGADKVSRASPSTVRHYLKNVQTILDKAGPPGHRNRDAADIIPRSPWVRPPHELIPPRKTVAETDLNACYLAAVAMEIPAGLGFKAPKWWRALLVTSYNTGLRTSTMLSLRMEWLDWQRCLLVIPPATMKSRRVHVLHLNATTMEHLRAIRTRRELIFPWPFNRRAFYPYIRRLMKAAALPPERWFGLQALRRTLATRLWSDSPQAAQFALGHAGADVTMRHYVAADGIVAAALDRLPQPEAFTGGMPS
jgi:integrase/predicted transcriptional regulator